MNQINPSRKIICKSITQSIRGESMSLNHSGKLDDIEHQMSRCADSLEEISEQLSRVITLLRKIEKKS